MKRSALLFFALIISHLSFASLDVNVKAGAALLINAKTGAVLYEKNASKPMFPASTTKIATGLYALQCIDEKKLSEKVSAHPDALGAISSERKIQSGYKLPPHWIEIGSSHIGIKPKEVLSVKDLLHGVLLASGNDASNVLAFHLRGSISKFVDEMNQYLKGIGCQHTHFLNVHGLHHPEHCTSAHDLAKMTQVGLKNPLFKKIVGTKSYRRPKTNKQESTLLFQTNKLLKAGKFYYPKAFGVKTGHTKLAGYNLVSAAKNDKRELIAVILNAADNKQSYQETIKLFEAAFNEQPVNKILIPKGEQAFSLDLKGASSSVHTYTNRDLAFAYYPSEHQEAKSYLYWGKLDLPVHKGQKVGELRAIDKEGNVLDTVSILAARTVYPSVLYKMGDFVHQNPKPAAVVLVLLSLTLLASLYLRRVRRR